MIRYLAYSILCMGALLLFYHFVLSKEKVYQVNRYFLLFSLLFSLTVPLIPVGMMGDFGFHHPDSQIEQSQIVFHQTGNSYAASSKEQAASVRWGYAFSLGLYCLITFCLLARLIWHLYQMRLRTLTNPAVSFKRHKVVLLDEDIVPHTFGKIIFANKGRYENGHIRKEVMLHELTHARHNHSADILFLEILKAIGWFNPLFHLYKRAIQLNHEYIADESVISNGADIATYQTLLLDMRATKPVHYLGTRFNFKTTKKRFKMMTKNNITTRSYLKTALIIPIFLMLGVTFGCNPMNPQQKQNASKIQQAITPSNITPPGESQTGKSLKNIDVKLIGLQTIKIDGKVVSFSASKAVFTSLLKKHPNSIISIKAGKNTPKGLLTKLQHILQQAGALRINYSVTQPKGHSRHKSQRLTLNQRNILKLYVNGAGDIFANQTRTPLSSVKGLVEKFITNNGKVSNLSESPQKAIISIKIDKTAPYDVYINMVQKAVNAYDDLRNKASEKLFAKPFQSLKKGGKQRIKIENMYPKQISIAMPSKG